MNDRRFNFKTPEELYKIESWEYTRKPSHSLPELRLMAKDNRKCLVCGQPVWRYGGCELCFTCTTGESDPSDDYELEEDGMGKIPEGRKRGTIMESNGPEVAGEDYSGNKKKDKKDALVELIDGATNDLILFVADWLSNDSPLSRHQLRKLAIEEIKKYLK